MGTTQPIKSTEELNKVRAVLSSNRDRALFELGVGTAFRGGDLLGLKIQDVLNLKYLDDLVIREQKTTKLTKSGRVHSKPVRRVTLNQKAAGALADIVAERLMHGAKSDDWLFISQSGFKSSSGAALSTVSLTRLWKHWCALAGLDDLFGSHSGRKSFGYLNRVERGVSIEKLQKAYGHSSQSVTMAYICIQDDEMKAMYSEAF
jgi:integrase